MPVMRLEVACGEVRKSGRSAGTRGPGNGLASPAAWFTGQSSGTLADRFPPCVRQASKTARPWVFGSRFVFSTTVGEMSLPPGTPMILDVCSMPQLRRRLQWSW